MMDFIKMPKAHKTETLALTAFQYFELDNQAVQRKFSDNLLTLFIRHTRMLNFSVNGYLL